MGVVLGLVIGLGVLLIAQGLTTPVSAPKRAARAAATRTDQRSYSERWVASRNRRERAEAWPDVVDNIASAVRAGMSLPEALVAVGERGPEVLREPFVAFGRDYGASGRFGESLDALKDRLADPIGDRVIEALRIAREVGGGDLGRVLRTLSGFLRDDLRTRGELEARQSWTIGAARLSAAAPWIVLSFVAFQPGALASYATVTGVFVLTGGAAASFVAYRLMLRLGRLPEEARIFA